MKRRLCSLFSFPLFLSACLSPLDGGGYFLPPQYCNSPAYYVPPNYHWMTALSSMGDSLEIENGSVWKMDVRASYDVFYWSSSDPLVLTQNQEWFSSYNYKLLNQITGGSVPVNLFLGPVLANVHTKFLADFDFQQGVAILTDGSRWLICPRDIVSFYRWILNDCILIGSNSGWESSYDSILINSNMNHYVRARQF